MKNSISKLFLNAVFTLILIFVDPGVLRAQVTDVYTTTTDWVVPPCVFTVTVQAWGGGGAGGGSSATDRNGGGGGGGAYCTFTESVTPGETLRITVGAGGVGVNSGTGGAGGFSQVEHLTGSIVFCRAAGGSGGTKGANASSAGAGGSGGLISNNIPVNTGFRGGNGGNSDPNTGSSDRSGGGGGGAGTGANGTNGGIVTAGLGGATGGGNGGAGVTTTSNAGANGNPGITLGGGGGGSTTYNSGTRAGANGARGEVRITYTVGGCCPPPAIPVGIVGNANPCVGATEVYSTSSAGATDFLWEIPAGWVITSGANTNSITVTIGVGGGAIAVSPANSCDTLTPTVLPLNLCGAPAAANTIYNAPGTYSWVVPDCVTSVYVQAWGAGGGGGGIASQGVNCFSCSYVEACSAGGGGGGGGYVSRSYPVTPGQTYTIVVGAGGTAGPASSSSTATARDGGVGGNSTFSGPATATVGTLTALGGAAGRGARTLHNGSIPDHQGSNGLGGAGSAGLNGTVARTGGNGAVGMHSASCWDLSGGGGGGAGTSGNGGNATTLVCYGSVAGGAGGPSNGGNGGAGREDSGLSTQSFPGLTGIAIGGGGGGALIHLRNTLNTWITQPGGTGARGEVWLTYQPCVVLPVELVSFEGTCEGEEREFKWKTASESNNDYFTIEHSVDGKEFTTLKMVDGSGTSQSVNTYKTTVKDDVHYQYYRLRQTDLNGQMSTSDAISVFCDEADLSVVSIYPNPAQDRVTVAFNERLSGLHHVYIQDLQGRMVFSKLFDASSGAPLDLDVSKLVAGNYLLEVWSNATTERIGVARLTKE